MDHISEKFSTAVRGLCPDKYTAMTRKWLTERYGDDKAGDIWATVEENYLGYLGDLPDLGGNKNGHAPAIYGGLLIFALYPALPDQPPVSELQSFVQNLFMEPFMRLGRVFNLNRGRDMWLIDRVFQSVARRDGKDAAKWPDGFINVYEPYDREHHAS